MGSDATEGVFTSEKSACSLASVRTKYNVDFFGLVRFAFTLPFLQVNQKLNKTTRVLKVIQSLVYSFNRTRVRLEADWDHLFSWVSVRLFGSHPSVTAVFTPAQKIHTKGVNQLEFDSIEPNKTGVNTP